MSTTTTKNYKKEGATMTGAEIRQRIVEADVPIWRVADAFGITDGYFSKRLRHSFTDEEAKRLLEIIDKLKKEKANS